MCRVQAQTINLGYTPRSQFVEFHKRKQRWACIVAHRRAGKTVACVADMVAAALECQQPNPRFAYVAPLFVQAKDTAWQYVKQFCSPIPGTSFNESELRADLPNGARIRLYGADNYERLRGIYLDGVLFDEYADMPPNAWQAVIRPALSDRNGWAVFIGTPKGRNAFFEKWEESANPEWFRVMLKASETGILNEAELRDAEKTLGDDLFNQEYECDFTAALIGAYYGKTIKTLEEQGRVGNVPYDSRLPVYTAWDLGIDDATAIWFAQIVGKEKRIIDYYESSGVGLDHYAKLLSSKGYLYAEHFLPHDVEVKELGTGRSRLETLYSLGLKNVRVIPAQSVEDGINACRMMLEGCWFDATKTAKGLEALRQYQREWDNKLRVFKQRPLHDWTSHASDAARYLALGLPDYRIKKEKKPRPKGSWMAA